MWPACRCWLAILPASCCQVPHLHLSLAVARQAHRHQETLPLRTCRRCRHSQKQPLDHPRRQQVVLGVREVLVVLVLLPHPTKHTGLELQRNACSGVLQCVLRKVCHLIATNPSNSSNAQKNSALIICWYKNILKCST